MPTNPVVVGDATEKAHYDELWDIVDETVAKILAAGYSGATGYGTFRTTNVAKKEVTIPAGTLSANNQQLRIEFSGRQSSSDFNGAGIGIGTNDYYLVNNNAVSGDVVVHARIIRISDTSVAVSVQVAYGDVGSERNVRTGGTDALTVPDLDLNAFTLTMGMHSGAGSGTASKLLGYSVEFQPAV